MRAEMPSRFINEYSSNQAFVSEVSRPAADYNIFMKHFRPQEMISEVYECKDRGSKTVFDICDNHFNRESKDIYLTMCRLVDIITCNTDRMKDRIKEYTGRDAFVVKDPVTFPYRRPRYYEEKEPQVLWYGHGANLPAVEKFLDTNPTYLQNLTVVSNAQLETTNDKVLLKKVPWYMGLVENLIEDYDIVIIPTDGQKYWIKEKSPNRAIDALFSGKFVITDNPFIYGELKDFIYIGDINQGLKYYLENKEQVLSQIKAGQNYATVNYNHKEIYNEWMKALSLTS